MKIFAVADTHLSGSPPVKPMHVFGEHWVEHWEKIKRDWEKRVAADDLVLVAGDISWAMKFEEALVDLEAIASLPGQKILVKGNHDYWWQGLKKMNEAMQGRVTFLHNTFFAAGKLAVCGSRGWICPEEALFDATDQAIYQRELARVEASLAAAQSAGCTQIILMLHFPPFSAKSQTSGFVDLIKKYGVHTCVYGHLHDEAAAFARTGSIDGTYYYLVSCDFLGFNLQEIGLP
jgi:predicted phosphohydrolase